MRTTRARFGRVIAPLALAGVFALAACSSSPSATWGGPGSSSGPSSTAANGPHITSPANGATNVPAGMTIAYDHGAATTKVSLTDGAGNPVPGAGGYDASTWVPTKQLAYGMHYTATIESTGSNGKATKSTTSFTTMAAPKNVVRVQSALGDGLTYGIGMPIVITLGHSVSKDDEAKIQKRLTVASTPPQTGSWYWMSDKEIHYRPKTYWQPGTKLHIAVQTGGVPFGDGYYGRNDLTVDASITTNPLQVTVNDKTHEVTVEQNGKVVKTLPASLGKASTPSSSGAMVIMTRKPKELFDSSLGTGGIPVNSPDGYKELVYYTMRLTWGGQFIHAAPWSVASQGHTDVSHGCTNVSTANAKWLYENSHVGDPVTVENTKRKLAWGDGWTDWNVSWDTYLKGSAL
jgi:lipoprotein-anchoring transpeptidase ErfK/SrfK